MEEIEPTLEFRGDFDATSATSAKGVKLGGKGTFSTRPIMPNDRTLPVLTASSGMCQELTHAPQQFGHLYSITSSARARSEGGISIPNAFAVLRLMTSSNLVGCTTGRSAGHAPLRTRPA